MKAVLKQILRKPKVWLYDIMDTGMREGLAAEHPPFKHAKAEISQDQGISITFLPQQDYTPADLLGILQVLEKAQEQLRRNQWRKTKS